MKFINLAPTIPVKNMKESQKYYKEVLGFTPNWLWEDHFCSIGGGKKIEIHLSKAEKKFRGQTFYLYVDNADKYYKIIKLNGGKIDEEIRSTPWGMREFVVKDINGHYFRIGNQEKGVNKIKQYKFYKNNEIKKAV